MNESTKNQIIAKANDCLEHARNDSTEASVALNIGIIAGIDYALSRLGYRFDRDAGSYSDIVEA